MDVCCLNRPFDDQTQQRIRLETEAVLLILEHCQSGDWQLLDSEAIHFEVNRISDKERRQKVVLLLSLSGSVVRLSKQIIQRAITLESRSIPAVDALHLACAEAGNTDVFLTTDDRLLRKARRLGKILKVKVANPVEWLMEVTRIEVSRDEPC